jgi:uridine kinase
MKTLNPKNNLLLSIPFILGLAVKIALSFFFSSTYLRDLFVPFINQFVLSGFHNPWDFFFALGRLNSFPYPPAMLWIMSIPRLLFSPFLSPDWTQVTALHLFVARIPLLVFDIGALLLLIRILPAHQKRILQIYWLSPIVIFISYIHGQLDIIPTTLFLFVVYLILNRSYRWAALAFAVAAATKSHVLIATPFIFIFLYRQKIQWSILLQAILIFVITYASLLAPYIFSDSFRAMVLESPEQQKFFSFKLDLSPTLSFLVCPMIMVLVFFKFASYRKLNKEIFLMFLGFVFASLVVFVPPMPGWFLWSLPFLIYFYANNQEYSRAPFIFYNAVYFIYFLFFFEKEPPINVGTLSPELISNLALTITMASVGYISLWMFKIGVERNEELKVREAPVLIGIGGDSASGKHTVYHTLRNLLGKERSIPIFGDNFHKWERGNENWNVYTHLHPSGNNLHEEMQMAVALKDGRSIQLGEYDHDTGKFTDKQTVESNKFVFFVGLHPFYLKRMRDLMQIKIFMDTDESLRRHWKIQRDCKKRGYEKERVLEQIESREKDGESHIQPQKKYADLIIRFEPKEKITAETAQDAEIPFHVKFLMDNSIELNALIEKLQQISTLEVQHDHGLEKQSLTIFGSITAREVMEIAFNMNLNFDELLIQTNKWLKNYNGLTQLVFLSLYNETMQVK